MESNFIFFGSCYLCLNNGNYGLLFHLILSVTQTLSVLPGCAIFNVIAKIISFLDLFQVVCPII